MKRTHCRACRSLLGYEILDLGIQPPSNALTDGTPQPGFPLGIAQCGHCKLLQLTYDVPPELIFNTGYPLRTSKGSKQWLDHLAGLASEAASLTPTGGVVMEIGSNDGALLENLRGRCTAYGVDPSGIPSSMPVIEAPFGFEVAQRIMQADTVISVNSVAQIPDLEDFMLGLSAVLKPCGLAILEFPNLVTTINETQFDTIYHEHYSYLSVTALQIALAAVGLQIYKVQKIGTHGGSLRVFIARIGSRTTPMDFSVSAQIRAEDELDFYTFEHRVKKLRREFLHFMTVVEFTGLRVCGYGAAARGNTFLNYCMPYWDKLQLPAIADVNPEKVGKFAPGTGIPIVSEEEMLAMHPDYVLLLAWTWKDEAVKRLREFGYKGSFVIAIPKLEVFV